MKLDLLRKEINLIDKKIISNLKKRFDLVKKIKKIKVEEGLQIYDKNREKEIMDNIRKQADMQNLNIEFIKKLFKEIIKEAKRIQNL